MEFEIEMAEHSLGVAYVAEFLLSSKILQDKTEFSPLQRYPELTRKRAAQHDWAKFSHTKEFIDRYYPKSTPLEPLSHGLVSAYGVDFSSPEGQEQLTPIKEKAKFSKEHINRIDSELFKDLLDEAVAEEKISKNEVKEFESAMNRFEVIIDLVNREIFEELRSFRHDKEQQLTNKKIKEKFIFEFGHKFVAVDTKNNYWKGHESDAQIAKELLASQKLKNYLAKMPPQDVIRLYRARTKASPFLEGYSEELNQEMHEYLTRRNLVLRSELVRFYKTPHAQKVLCSFYYK